MITIVTVFYRFNANVPHWSRCYTPAWVDKLYRGVARHYSLPFKFICLADNIYNFEEKIEIHQLRSSAWNQACLQMHAIEGDKLVTMGLDTVITGDLHDLFDYPGPLAVVKDVYRKKPSNSVTIGKPIPAIADSSLDDMRALEDHPYEYLDDLYPRQVVSYKEHVVKNGLKDARIVYFHGEPKPHVLKEPWLERAWI